MSQINFLEVRGVARHKQIPIFDDHMAVVHLVDPEQPQDDQQVTETKFVNSADNVFATVADKFYFRTRSQDVNRN